MEFAVILASSDVKIYIQSAFTAIYRENDPSLVRVFFSKMIAGLFSYCPLEMVVGDSITSGIFTKSFSARNEGSTVL